MTGEFKSLIKNTKFIYIWISQIFSQLTINIVNFLLLIHLFNKTGSAIAVSLLWVAYAIPAILAGPFGAAAVDMVERRKMLIVTNLLQAIIIFGYALTNSQSYFLPYGVVMLYSLLNQFYVPAESATIPSIVPTKLLPTANGLFFVTQQAALVLGFGLAGVINEFFGYEQSLFLCSAFLFIAFISVCFLPTLKVKESIPDDIEKALAKFFYNILDGYNFIKGNKKILIPFLLLVAFQVVVSIIIISIPLIAKDLLKISLNSAGVLIIVPAGLGAAMGSYVFPKLLKRGFRKRIVIEISLKAASFSFLMLAFLIPVFKGSLSLIFSSLAILLTGFSFVGIMIASQTFLQEATPGGLRGRVFGNFWFIVTIVSLLPVLFSGAITELLGIRMLLLILSVGCLCAVIFSQKYAGRLIQDKFNETRI